MNEDQFAAFVHAVYGYEPFPWQRRLYTHVRERGWPDVLDLPTGTGKTNAMDIAIAHLAAEGDRGSDRRAPMRIVYVVDRRTIVDQAYRKAEQLAKALQTSPHPEVDAMRTALARFSGNGPPLHAALLRGGMPREDAWAKRPNQPTIVVSTVDQVGSRLLFRGYGVSDSMRPVHAGLLGHDTLFLLDEVHLAVPFRQTLRALDRLERESGAPRCRRVIVEMSATALPSGGTHFALDAADRAHAVLERRLHCAKPARLEEVKVPAKDPDKARERFAAACCAEALAPAREGKRVAVVVNRVATAQRVHELLRTELGDEHEAILVTGRMRGLDREALETKLQDRVGSGWSEDARPLVVVATQCIEAGADFDFDVLVTECASFDALRQRFGRLNRMGRPIAAQGVVLGRTDARGGGDPVYGDAVAKTWEMLSGIERVDFRPIGGVEPTLDGCISPATRAPTLLPAYVDAWAQTSPHPAPDPDVSLFLHGVEPTRPEVQLVWRGDIDESMLRAARDGDRSESDRDQVLTRLRARLELCPPSSLEALSLPIDSVREWLRDGDVTDVSDVEGERDESTHDGRRRRRKAGRPFIAWRGDDSAVRGPADLAPHDVVVVPAAYGGIAHGTWAPTSTARVDDLGTEANRIHRGRLVIRLHPGVLGSIDERTGELDWTTLPRVDDRDRASESFAEWADERRELLTTTLRGLDLSEFRVLFVDAIGEPRGFIALVRKRPEANRGSDATSEGEVSSFTGVPSLLRDHLRGVEALAREFSERCGLPIALASDVALAARWHDLGKVDPRFQVWLHGGDELAAAIASDEPLAKSRTPATDLRARQEARRRSGYPEGARHELVSVAMLARWPPLAERAHDPELVLHLVASHHGHCRPLAPIGLDGDPVTVRYEDEDGAFEARTDHEPWRLGEGAVDRFFTVQRRYGWFRLAYLEAVMRLADHRRSQAEQEGTAS